MTNRGFRILGVGAFAAWGVTGVTVAAPVAEPFSTSWQLEFRFHDPQRITVQLPGDSQETRYWYMLYEVVNQTGRDVAFYPSFRLVTDTLQVVEGGADIHPRVYDLIAARHKIEFPLLTVPSKVTGLLLQGEENARASVAVFRAFDPKASGFTAYVAGLSGEVARIPNPAFNPAAEETEENARSFILRRTLAIEYALPGDDATSGKANPIRRNREWVMR
jgi:hypothetical protein